MTSPDPRPSGTPCWCRSSRPPSRSPGSPPLGDDARRDLAAAFAADTVAPCLACELVDRVLVVTDDHVLARGAVRPRRRRDPRRHQRPQRHPGAGRGGDAPPRPRPGAGRGLRGPARAAPDELASALAAAAPDGMSFVADRERLGTTVVVAADLTRSGRVRAGSRRQHLEAGAREIDGIDVPSVRRDVDDRAGLGAALDLGVGPRTSLVATALRL